MGPRTRGALAVAIVVGVLLAGALILDRRGEDPYGGAFTGPCAVRSDGGGRTVGELRLTDHGPPVGVGRIAVAFADSSGTKLPMARVEVGQGQNVSVLHRQTQTFMVAAPAGARTCRFVDWAEAQTTTWGGQGAG
jgi:hypothetical protein